MPRKIISDEPPPSSPRTFPISAFLTPRAIPMRLPSTSRPKMVPAQCEPCPCRSPLPEPLKSFSTIVTPAKAGCFLSIPVSNTATTTPSPGHRRGVGFDRRNTPCISRRCGSRGYVERLYQFDRHGDGDRSHIGIAGGAYGFMQETNHAFQSAAQGWIGTDAFEAAFPSGGPQHCGEP